MLIPIGSSKQTQRPMSQQKVGRTPRRCWQTQDPHRDTRTSHDELVGHQAPRHDCEHPPRRGDVVVGAVQRVTCMRDRLPLPVQVVQDADAQLLRACTDVIRAHMTAVSLREHNWRGVCQLHQPPSKCQELQNLRSAA